jgi:hypothetical protein
MTARGHRAVDGDETSEQNFWTAEEAKNVCADCQECGLQILDRGFGYGKRRSRQNGSLGLASVFVEVDLLDVVGYGGVDELS